MKIKSVAAAALLVAASVGASAAGGALGSLGPIGAASFSSGPLAPGASFSDVWTFSLVAPSSVSASASNVEVFVGPSTFNNIIGFAALLDSTPLSYTLIPFGGGAVQVLAASTGLGAGGHTLTISGTAGSFGATYSGTVVAAPVPEPETLAMMLAGLGSIGFMALRRRQG